MTNYATSWPALAPPWLRDGVGAKYMSTLQQTTDILVGRATDAMKIRLPGVGDASNLPYLANDRALVQGPSESNDAFVARLRTAHQAWKHAGSAQAILGQIQSYISNLQPGVGASTPAVAIVSGSYSTVTQWTTIRIGDVPGVQPTVSQVRPSNWNWDGANMPWRSWLIVYLSLVSAGLGGGGASLVASTGGSLLGQNVSGVWVPGTSGSPVNTPFWSAIGLTGLTSANVGHWLQISGSVVPANNTISPIVLRAGTVGVIANPSGSADAGPLNWSVLKYPWIGPAPVWGAPGFVLGQGQATAPPVDTGSNIGGVWQPSLGEATYGTSLSWGLNCSSQTVRTIRALTKAWKSASTYFPEIVFAFDGGTGVAGSAYSPLSAIGSGNPDGTFGDVGRNVAGVWSPTRKITSAYDAHCQGTGSYVSCSVENVT